MNKHLPRGLSLHQAALYRIEVQGRLDEVWSANFSGMQVLVHTESSHATVTSLTGTVADQSSLHGMLNLIRDLGLPLLRVELIGLAPEESTPALVAGQLFNDQEKREI